MQLHIANATIHINMAANDAGLALFTQGELMTKEPSITDGALTPPAMGEYWPSQGGHYICTLPALLGMPARHLIAGSDEAEDMTFGPYQDIADAGSHIDGAANTASLLKAADKHPAAQWASAYTADGHTDFFMPSRYATDKHPAAQWANAYTADGHTDFFLPSRYDLLMAYLCAPKLFNTSGWYWSSTQLSRSCAFVQSFEYGTSGWLSKDNERRVRAFRVIPLQTFCA